MQVNLLLSKWMRELEKVFYINIDAFNRGMLPEAKQDDVQGFFGGEFSYYIALGSNLSRINVTKGIIGIPWLLGAVLVLGC